MLSLGLRRRSVGCLAFIVWAAVPAASYAQGPPPKEPHAIAALLREGIRYERRAMVLLGGAQSPEEIEEARRLAYEGYVRIRAAHEGLDARLGRAEEAMAAPPGLPQRRDPRRSPQSDMIEVARKHILAARFVVGGTGPEDVARIEEAVDHLREAINQIERVLGLGIR